jgi:hypothetical protein
MRNRPSFVLTASLFAATIVAAQQSSPVAQAPDQPASGASATNAAPAATASTPAPTKKVWTNEDVPALRGGDPISTFNGKSTKPDAKPTPVSKNGKAFQAQIARLEAQIPPLDAQIAELQSAIDGKPTGDGRTSQRPRGVKADDWGVEMQALQNKRQNIVDQIAALKDQARHQGVPPNTLP